MKKLLLTGTSGFLGGALLNKLCDIKKYDITALSSKQPNNCNYIFHNNYNFSDNYLDDVRVDVLIHAGAFTPKNQSEANDIELCFSNIKNTLKLLNSGVNISKKLIFISSLDVYSSSGMIDENTIPQPVSLYGMSKLYCEQMIKTFALQNNLEYIILRIGHVYGPGEEKYQKIIPNTIRSILNQEKVKIYNGGKAKRSFIYVDDVVNAICNSIEYDGNEKYINVVGNEQKSISEIIDILEAISNSRLERELVQTKSNDRDTIFNVDILQKTLLSNFTPIQNGLKAEMEYMKKVLFEKNIF